MKGKEAVYIGGPGSGVVFDVTPVDMWRRMHEGKMKRLVLLDRAIGNKVGRDMREDLKREEEKTEGYTEGFYMLKKVFVLNKKKKD